MNTPWFPSSPTFERKPFKSSFPGALYLKADDASFERWKETGELRFLKRVDRDEEERKTA